MDSRSQREEAHRDLGDGDDLKREAQGVEESPQRSYGVGDVSRTPAAHRAPGRRAGVVLAMAPGLLFAHFARFLAPVASG
ncbi:MAG: hypothetical protein KJ062_10090 [Thermoanaerobaculia bacterium]|nr:hypothetical protein [Thermoanaerobaculia bacterium]